jgi:SAM-dependent methyltransferase
MPSGIDDLKKARQALALFRAAAVSPYHERYSFPLFSGSYFAYRKVDVMRVAAIARSVSDDPSYLDVGCGYGDFLRHVREILPKAEGIEKSESIFYGLGVAKPDHLRIADAHWLDRMYDVIFVGWMEPGQDFRRNVARFANCVMTTFDAGGQCGINGGCEYEEFGYERIAWWKTPSWIDVNTELMNKYYTPGLAEEKKEQLARLRSAHNYWYVYTRPGLTERARAGLKSWLATENAKDRYDFESVLDDCGFGYKQELPALTGNAKLWEVIFD